MSSPVRALVAPVLLLLGAAVGVCAVALHGYTWGLLLGLAATGAVLVALPRGWWARPAFALGWVAVLAWATPERPEGDFLVTGDARGYVLLATGMAVLATGVVGLFPPRRTALDADGVGTLP